MFGKTLKRIREGLAGEVTRERLAEVIADGGEACGERAVLSWENGEREPSKSLRPHLWRALRVLGATEGQIRELADLISGVRAA